MKKTKLLILAILPLFLFSCSKDSEEPEPQPQNKYVVAIHNLATAATAIPDFSDGIIKEGLIFINNSPEVIEVGDVYPNVVTEVELPSDYDASQPLLFAFKLGKEESGSPAIRNSNFFTANYKDDRIYGFYATPNTTTHLYFYELTNLYQLPEFSWTDVRNKVATGRYGSWK